MASTGWCTHGHGQTWGIMGAITNKRSGRKKQEVLVQRTNPWGIQAVFLDFLAGQDVWIL